MRCECDLIKKLIVEIGTSRVRLSNWIRALIVVVDAQSEEGEEHAENGHLLVVG